MYFLLFNIMILFINICATATVGTSVVHPKSTKSSGANKVISDAIALTIRISGMLLGNLHLLRRFRTKSDGAVKLIYVVYKVKQGDSLV